MKTNNIYTVISFILTGAMLLAVIALLIFAPSITDWYIEFRDNEHIEQRNTVLVLVYLVLAVALVALSTLLKLLKNVSDGIIFSHSTFIIMTLLSLYCFAECMILAFLGFIFPLSFVLSFAALMLGALLLVVRYVLAEATEIKCENDYTV